MCQKESQKKCQKEYQKVDQKIRQKEHTKWSPLDLNQSKGRGEDNSDEIYRPKGPRFHQGFPLLLVLPEFITKNVKIYVRQRWRNNLRSRWASLDVKYIIRDFLCFLLKFESQQNAWNPWKDIQMSSRAQLKFDRTRGAEHAGPTPVKLVFSIVC